MSKGHYKYRNISYPAFYNQHTAGGLVLIRVKIEELPKKIRNIRRFIWIREDSTYMIGL